MQGCCEYLSLGVGRREGNGVPLTRLYRLGPSPQRIRKGYVIAGSPDAVSALRKELHGRHAARDVTVTTPSGNARALMLDTGWWWLHDRESREIARATLTEAVVKVASAAGRRDCRLLPCAVRPSGEASWQDWLIGDHHSIGLLDDIEREVATNLFRSHVPEIIALTGHPGISPTPEPLGSRRLAESGEHLAARYLASASARHLSLVETELRRTTGIRDLRAMDIHPLDPAYPGGEGSSLGVRCVDGQAFIGTTIAHAILLQALGMSARRLVRDGRRQGNTDQEMLERRRASAILKGIDARVPTETFDGPDDSRKRGRNGERRDSGRVSLDVLALELLDQLIPEFGTLEASFEELAPVAAWTAALTESVIPRNEAELLARNLQGANSASHEIIANMVAAPDWHSPGRFIKGIPFEPSRLRTLAQQWEARLTEPPPGAVPRPRAARPESPSRQEKTRSQERPERKAPTGKPGQESAMADQIRRLAELPEGDPAAHVDLIAALMKELPSPSSELVPWLGQRNRELVTQARRRLRPPAERLVSCPPAQLRLGSAKVDQACRAAHDGGIAMLRTTAGAGDRQSVLDAATNLAKEANVPSRFVILDVNSFKGKDGDELVSVELLVMPNKEMA
jgi:hypothetical protein